MERVLVASFVVVAIAALLLVRGRVSMLSSFLGASFRLSAEQPRKSIDLRRARSDRDMRLADHVGDGVVATDLVAGRDLDVVVERHRAP
jgi:hypothetical protein